MKSLSRVRLSTTPWAAAHQAPPSMGFSRQEYWSGVPLPSPVWVTASAYSSRDLVSRVHARLPRAKERFLRFKDPRPTARVGVCPSDFGRFSQRGKDPLRTEKLVCARAVRPPTMPHLHGQHRCQRTPSLPCALSKPVSHSDPQALPRQRTSRPLLLRVCHCCAGCRTLVLLPLLS